MTGVDAKCIFDAMDICFQSANQSTSPSIFGIGEFLTAIAIFAVAYNMSEARYKFRIAVAPISIHRIFFVTTVITGVGLVVLPFWFQQKLPVPASLNDERIFEAFFAAEVIGLIALWTYVAFIKPPTFSRRNAFRFAQRVFQAIADGEETELSAVVYEVGRSAGKIISEAQRRVLQPQHDIGGVASVRTESAKIAHDLILLLGDRRFCRSVARHSPWVAAEFFRSLDKNFSDVPIAQFAKNVASELFANTDSAIHHEDDGFKSGLIGFIKPVSTSLFGNSILIDALAASGGSPLDSLWLETRSWRFESWKAYNKAVRLYFDDRLRRFRSLAANTTLYQIVHAYEHACNDLYKLNGMSDESYGSSIEYKKISIIVEFIQDILESIDRAKLKAQRLAQFDDYRVVDENIVDLLADVAKNLLINAGSISTTEFKNWQVQHNSIWAELMRDYQPTYAQTLFRSRLQRLIWREIRQMERMPNYSGARLIAVCLNVMGLEMNHAVHKPKETRALKRALVRWMRHHYRQLLEKYPDVARSCIGGTISYDEDSHILTKTYGSALGKEGKKAFLSLA